MNKDDLAKKTKLEIVDELDHYFEITAIKDEAFLLREIRRKIIEKYDSIFNVLHSLLHPDSSIIELSAADCLSNEDRELTTKILKAFSVIIKQHQILELDSNPRDEKQFCKDALNLYKEKINDIKMLMSKAKDSYLNNISQKENINYLG